MKIRVIPIIICAHGTMAKSLELGLNEVEIRGRFETEQSTVMLAPIMILRKMLEI